MIGLIFVAVASPPAMPLAAIPQPAVATSEQSADGPNPPPVFYRQTPVADPARLAAARSVATKLLPAGSYRKMVNDPMMFAMVGIGHQIVMEPVAAFLREVGLPPIPESRNGPPTLQLQILRILDPASMRRLEIGEPILAKVVADTADRIEPDIREAIAIAYSRRFTVEQLSDLDHFLATPSGRVYASQTLSLQNDLDILAANQKLNSAILQAAPIALERMSAASTGLPKPKTAADITDGERADLARLLGVDPARLKVVAGKPTQ